MKWTCMAVLAVSMFGCASQKQYDELRALYRRSQDQVESLKAQLEEAQARIAALTAAGRSTDPRMLNELQRALEERDKALAALKDAEDALRKLGRGTGPMLDPDTDAALAELAAAHPGLLTYDAQRGM
ncbi:MAG: hypothetical protein IT442_17340, partial [Phycisphaeraceae bacterium]|nr:hypothetical protein [Phycisphaeraceae bacterium]